MRCLCALCVQVIAYTILDINRTTRINEQPMTPEQLRQLERMAKEIQSRPGALMSSNAQLCCTPASCLLPYWSDMSILHAVDPLQQLEYEVRRR